MGPFEFHGELFEVRAAVLDHLADNGFVWLSDFGAVDLQHDIYGLEVTAIYDEEDARAIEQILRTMFPGWHFARTLYEDMNIGELGWKVMVSKQPEQFEDKALTNVEIDADQKRRNWLTLLVAGRLRTNRGESR